jgi:hypothetical protein
VGAVDRERAAVAGVRLELNPPRSAPFAGRPGQRRPILQRSFSDWALQFRKAEDSGFDELLEELTGGVGDPRLREQVRRFAQLFLTSPGRKWSEAVA